MNDGRKEVAGGVTPQTSDRSLLKNSWKKVTRNNSLKKQERIQRFWLLSKTFGHVLPRFTSGVFWGRGSAGVNYLTVLALVGRAPLSRELVSESILKYTFIHLTTTDSNSLLFMAE